MIDGQTDIFHRGIHLLLERWEKVIANNRKYFEQILIMPLFKQTSFILCKKQCKLTKAPGTLIPKKLIESKKLNLEGIS